MLSFDDALARILAAVPAPQTERLSIDAARDRILASAIVAGHDQPPFDASAMDGYAVRAAGIEVGTPYPVVGESQAGTGLKRPLAEGQVARIFTGAPLPDGADAVIIQENAVREGEQVRFNSVARAGQNIRARGLDFAKGAQLLKTGSLMGPAASALTAAANVAEIEAFRQPRVALLSTGDELLPPGSVLKAGQIIGSNGFALRPMFAPYAETIVDLGNAPDDEATLRDIFARALASDVDIIISSGGASVGDHDLVQPVLQSLGVEVDFWKIAMRPGKPLMFGKWKDKLLFALPGNPVSSFVTALTIVVPALRRANGYDEPVPKPLFLPLAAALPENASRRHFIRGSLVTRDDQTMAMPFSQTDSAHLSSLAAADVLIVHKENGPPAKAGEPVECILLP